MEDERQQTDTGGFLPRSLHVLLERSPTEAGSGGSSGAVTRVQTAHTRRNVHSNTQTAAVVLRALIIHRN